MQYELRPHSRFSLTTVAALVVAVASFVVSCTGHGFAGLMLACIGMAVGVVAFLRAHASGPRDGAICLLAICISVFDLVPAIAVMITHTLKHT